MPPKLQQLPRVLRLVSDFLQPKTLDVAVYRNLQRVIIAHGNSRPCTGRALDFAAAHGHLGVLRMSRASRRGRFSSAALTGAAANGHLDVVKWLSKKLRAVKNRHLYLDEALRAAAVNGHVEVVRFLRTRCGQPAITFALQLAAGRNQVSVVKMLLPWMFVPPDSHYVHCHEIPETKERTRWPSRTAWGTQLPDYVAVRDIPPMEAAINAAASNGHVETVELLLKMESSYELYGLAGIKSTEEEDTGLTNETAAEEEEDSSYALYGLADVTTAVEDATINGHLAVVQLLVESHNPCSTTFALLKATASGDIEAVEQELTAKFGGDGQWAHNLFILRTPTGMDAFLRGRMFDLVCGRTLSMSVKWGRIAFVHPLDVAETFSALLLHKGGVGGGIGDHGVVTLTGPDALTFQDVAKVLTEGIGDRVNYSHFPLWAVQPARWVRGVPGDAIEEELAVIRALEAGAQGKVDTEVLEKLLGRKPRSFREFVAENADAWPRTDPL
ncbi:RxLR effector candidate precursor [Phytophthora cinnamomi]|uniref:RxLR effector candidate precursor n=1 Tax=Phytophthora cinnamomi TaxID=4785 RepID=UPI00355AA5A8|nr:RxLR effector candidate precursor [Phytophthora cinnamomi]